MPKLDRKQAAAVEAATAATGSLLLEPGEYAAQLRSVDEADGTEYPYWIWEFHNLHDQDGNPKPGRQWNNTSLSPKSAGFMKATFEAFGYTADTDTDEIIDDGAWVVLVVDQEVQTQGKNVGKTRNNVTGLLEFVEADWPGAPYPDVKAGAGAGAGGGARKGADF